MNIKHLFLGLALTAGLYANAQSSAKEILFTIDGKPYYTDEFLRVYNKNIDLVKDESQKDPDQYLDLFVGYKLKISKAHKLGLQNGESYQAELRSHRNQLSKNYLTDSKVTDHLIQEAYSRSKKEVRASHILVLVNENASPADTLTAFKKITDIREKALKGEDFGELAVAYSEDPSAKENKGDLGYFSAFRMVYPFENAAFNTPKGQISKIAKTRFGYHIIKVADVRENRGQLTAAHIMILKPQDKNQAETEKAKTTINEIYTKLQQGENFESLAKQFSQDQSSAPKGGVLNRFGSGELSSEEFEEAAFALAKPGDYSKPVESAFGWHIIKLIEKHPVASFEDVKTDLENKIKRDERSRLITASMNEKLRNKYPIKRNEKLYNQIVQVVNDEYYKGEWKAPENTNIEGNLFNIENQPVKATEFISFLESEAKAPNAPKPVSKLVLTKYQSFVDKKLNEHYNQNLEKEFPEFAAVMDEYRDGLLLFDLMEKEIWEKAKTDSIGLQKFYESRKNQYQWNNRVEATVLSSTKADFMKNVQKMLKQGKSADQIKENFNKGGKVNVMSNEGIFDQTSNSLPKGLNIKTGVSDVIHDGEYYYVVKITKQLPAGNKTFEEAKGKVVNDYQQYLEEKWVSDLKKEFNVEVNQAVFNTVKGKMKS
ncbi:peptidylprolyl isomerase [Flavobacterium sp. NST-5]|uniref:Peptidylprolyl isomerase n=1 Tax=Flavobacterium ichthyis TaxID=2698827 RepID=A0ABW9Z8K4_9FLAO|nr:peptidylprolyl isomerase [Flavobacterium ichthyis]NBL64430.1 peptidylprolyl isomerase [Flavobacterium ichthyis]